MPHNNADLYYALLGLQPGATPVDIKRAYRKKAVQLHPDRNKSATAHDDFILLTEAYEYLINGGQPEDVTTYGQQWESAAQQRARRRAEYYANMNYKDFTGSDFYKKAETYNYVASNLIFIYAVLMAVVLPFVVVSLYGLNGIYPCIVMLLISLPFVIREVYRNDLTDPSVFFSSLYSFLGNRFFQGVIILFINFFIFVTIGVQTLIVFKYLASAYLVSVGLGYLFCSRLTGYDAKYKRHFYSLCMAPMAISVLLLLNFFISNNQVEETYSYRRDGGTTLIELPENKYDEYPGIRFFVDGEFMRGNDRITYTFRTGLFGVRVMRQYQFWNT